MHTPATKLRYEAERLVCSLDLSGEFIRANYDINMVTDYMFEKFFYRREYKNVDPLRFGIILN